MILRTVFLKRGFVAKPRLAQGEKSSPGLTMFQTEFSIKAYKQNTKYDYPIVSLSRANARRGVPRSL
jgi:hypothetical protein